MTSRQSQLDSKYRASSTSRNVNTSRTMHKFANVRHPSVPYNRSTYSKTNKEGPKSFFKGAVEFLQASDRNSLGDRDQSLKKILDDSKVQKHYNEKVKESLDQDMANYGLLHLKSNSKVCKTIDVNAVMNTQRHANEVSKHGSSVGFDLIDVLQKGTISAKMTQNSALKHNTGINMNRLNTMSQTPKETSMRMDTGHAMSRTDVKSKKEPIVVINVED